MLTPDTMSRFSGPLATELFLRCGPANPAENMHRQAYSAFRMLQHLVSQEGGRLENVLRETVFFRDIAADMPQFLGGRQEFLNTLPGPHTYHPASVFIGQAPLNGGRQLEIAAYAVIPNGDIGCQQRSVRVTAGCSCSGCSRLGGRVLALGHEKHLHSGNVYGPGGDVYQEAYGMFQQAEELLRQEGMHFGDVTRTWIYFRHMESDYVEFNRARRDFFQRCSLSLRPASTGIAGLPFPAEHNLSMSFSAIDSLHSLPVSGMSAPTLNEAWSYGSDFSRGLKIEQGNVTTLYISGTASVDKRGSTAHAGDFLSQAERMILNISTLLSEQHASIRDVVTATSYLKNPAHAELYRQILERHGLHSFPNILVRADICRPELLCEMEAIALLPRKEKS